MVKAHRVCDHCGRVFVGTDKRRFCSDRCRVAAHRGRAKGCRICAGATDKGLELRRTGRIDRFCSDECLTADGLGYLIVWAMDAGYPEIATVTEALTLSVSGLMDGEAPLSPVAVADWLLSHYPRKYMPGDPDCWPRLPPGLKKLRRNQRKGV